MEISPSRSSAILSSQHRAENRGESRSEDRVTAQERETRQRIAAAQRLAEDAEAFAEKQVDHIKGEFQTRQTAERQRQEESLQAEREKHEQVLQALKKAQYEQLTKLRRTGEDELARLKDYYLRTVYELEKQGKERLFDVESRNTLMLDHEKKQAEGQLADQTTQHQKHLELLRQQGDQQRAQLTKANRDEYARLHADLQNAVERYQQTFDEQYQSRIAEQSQALDAIQNETSQKLRELREETSRKLTAYSTRQEDPFYKMLKLDVEVEDNDEQYVISARIPEHEQKNVSVVLKGNQLVINGYRKSEERLEPHPGHVQSTSTYQTFQESIPLHWPVDAKQLTRCFEDDQLIVTVPKTKREPYQSYRANNAGKPGKARAEKPVFPDNLPLEGQTEGRKTAGETAPSPGKGTRGSRTLG